MNLAGFCRNCLSKWYVAAAEDARAWPVDYEAARERVYGMPYGEWKARYQADASPGTVGGVRQTARVGRLPLASGPQGRPVRERSLGRRHSGHGHP